MIEEAASLWSGIKKYEEILGRDPQALSFAPLAELYRKVGLLEEALAVAKRGTLLYPDFAAGQMVLGRIFIDRSMKKEAVAPLETVVRITPENTEAQRLLAAIYNDAGNPAAAQRCYAIVNALEPDSVDKLPLEDRHPEFIPSTASTDNISPQDFSLHATGEGLEEEEILDADILDLTEDLVEEESSYADSFSAFSAAPERPSLQASPPAPGLQAANTVDLEETGPTSTVATATIAELYISQGLKDKGANVYRELLLTDPENPVYRKRLIELSSASETSIQSRSDAGETPLGVIAPAPPLTGAVETLEGWLSNIRRVKECRSEHP